MKTIQYDYVVHHIKDGNSIGYKAIIPAFNGVVFGDNLVELENGVALAIEEEINFRKKTKKLKSKIPKPDSEQKYSGKFMVRMSPALHEKMALAAKARGKSLNSYIAQKIDSSD